MAFSKSLQKGQIPVGCELCDGGKKIKYKCLDCEVLMCSKCKDKVHARFKNSSLHIIKDIKDLGQQEEVDTFNFNDVKCLDHSYQACCVFCKTCKEVICVKCVTKVHNGHTFIDEEELDNKKQIINTGQKKAEKSVNDLSSSSVKLQSIKQQEDAKFRQMKQNILTHKEALKSEVDKYADNILKDLEQTCNSNSRVIGAEQSKIDKTLEKLQTDSKTVKSVITSKDFVKFFDDFDKLVISFTEVEPLRDLQFSLLGRFMPGKIEKLNFGSMESGENLQVQHSKIELKVAHQYTTQLRHIHRMAECPDGTLWIADIDSNKLQYIKFDKNNVEIVLEFNISILGMAVMNACNNLLIIPAHKTRLKIINSTTGRIKDSKYDVKSYSSQSIPAGIHITNDHRVIVGVGVAAIESAVIVMGQDGRTLTTHEHNSNKEPLFASPVEFTSTKNGNICVIDVVDSDDRRVIVLGKEGEIKHVYTGQPTINTEDESFLPNALITTPADNIVITDLYTCTLHVLNCEGNFIGYYNLYDLGIVYPCSLAMSTEGRMYIGCLTETETLKAKVYEVEYSGF